MLLSAGCQGARGSGVLACFRIHAPGLCPWTVLAVVGLELSFNLVKPMNTDRRRVLIAGAAALVLVAAGGFVLFAYGPGGETPRELVLSGNVEATEVHLAFKMAGRLRSVPVEEGDRVGQGQEVARLTDDELRAREAQGVAAVEIARAEVARAKAALNYSQQSRKARVAVAQAAFDATRGRLLELERGARTQEVKRAEAEVDMARADLDRARAEWQRAQKLFGENSIPESQRDQAKADFEKATAGHRASQESFELIKEGPRREAIDTARAEVARAEAALLVADETTKFEIARNEQGAAAAEARVRLADAELVLARVQLDYACLRAPLKGRVIRRNVEEGELVVAGTPVLTVANLRQPWVRAYLNERDLGRVHLGQAVTVTTDRADDGVFKGTVSFISDRAEFTPKNVETRAERVRLVYRIKISVDNPDEKLKPGMPVTVRMRAATSGEEGAP